MAFSTMKHMKFSEYSNRPGNVHFSEQPCFDPDLPTITEFFKDRDIFITGGSGFMGKVLIEKLLRSCPGINKIFLLVRPKKGKDIEERLDAIRDTRLFDTLKESFSNVLPKMVAVQGDVTRLGLGLSSDDLKKMENVSVIFHAAASVRFDDPLKKAILLNVRGTREVMELALSLKNIAAVMHVSTTYCKPDLHVIEEDLLPPYCDWQDAIRIAESIDEDVLDTLTTKFIQFMPNTYTFSKNLSEQCIRAYKDKLPLLIFRPSIVISTMKDPIAGWMDNFNGPVGLLVGCGIGLTRTMYCNPDNIADFIPVDVAIKAMIVAVWKRAVDPKSIQLPIYNCSTSNIRNATMLQIIEMGKALSNDVPLNKILWAPGGGIARNRFTNFIKVILYHLLPAFFIDFLLKASGKKPFIANLQRKIYTANNALEYFILNNWDFKNRNFLELANEIKPEDNKEFYYRDFIEFDIMLYFKNCILGARRFLLHDKDEDLPKAKRHLKRMKLLDLIVKVIFGVIFVYLVLTKSSVLTMVEAYLGRFKKLDT